MVLSVPKALYFGWLQPRLIEGRIDPMQDAQLFLRVVEAEA